MPIGSDSGLSHVLSLAAGGQMKLEYRVEFLA